MKSIFKLAFYNLIIRMSHKYAECVKDIYISFNRHLFYINKIKYGKNLLVYNQVYLKTNNNSEVIIGDNFNLVSNKGYNPIGRNLKSSIFVGHDAQLIIGNNVGVSNSVIWVQKYVKIGNYVQIGADSIIIDTDAHSIDWETRMKGGITSEGYWIDGEKATKSPIVIGDNVLIGTRSIILKGVTIGDRTVIGAGSVVTSSIPSDCIAAGNPCKVIKYLSNKQ